MKTEQQEIIYTRIADVDTSWMKSFNTDLIDGFLQNGVKLTVIPERAAEEDQSENTAFMHKLSVLESFSEIKVSGKDILFVSCPLRCSLDQLVWSLEVVKQEKPFIACYTLTGTFIEEDWVTFYTPWVSHLEKVWYEKSDAIFVPTEYFKQKMIEQGYSQEKISVVGFPLNSERITAGSQPRDKNLIIFNHRLNIDKKPNYFLRMVRDLSGQFPNLEFIISTSLNEGDFWSSADSDTIIDLKNTLARFQSSRIQFNKSKEEYFRLLNKAYLAPCFATHETFGVSVAESLAAGCLPIIPSRLTYPELVQKDIDLLYSSSENLERDYEAALEKVIYWLSHPELGEKKSLEIKKYAEQFQPKKVTARILNQLFPI